MAWVNEHGERVGRRPSRPSSHGGSWFDAPENPFNQMDYTRGGGGEDNRNTRHSNARRAHGMTGVDALPRFASPGVAQAAIPGRGYAVVDGNIIRTTGPGAPGASSNGGGGAGPGNAGVTNARPRTAGAGSQLVISVPGSQYVRGTAQRGKEQGTSFADDEGPLLDVWEMAPVTPMMAGGRPVVHDRGWSDAGQAEERWGEGELLSPTWFYQWGVAGADVLANIAEHARGWREEQGLPQEPTGGGGLQTVLDAFGRQFSRRDGALDGVATTFVTGGGF